MPVDPDLLRKVLAITAHAESRDRDYNPDGSPVRSPAGALYRMQVLPSTAASPGFGVQPATAQTPEAYNRVGADLMRTYLEKYNNPGKAWAAYHSGVGNLDKWVRRYGDNWQQGLGRQGAPYVKNNLAALGVRTLPDVRAAAPAPEETQMEDDTETADNGFGVKDVLDEYRQTTQSLAAQQKAEAEARRQQFEAARDALAKQRFGPSKSEQLFALAAALGRPRYQQERGFGAVMGDIAQPLSDLLNGKREAETQRAEALRKLQDSYLNGTLDSQRSAIDARAKMLPTLASLAKTPRPRTGFNPLTGVLTNLDTNTEVEPPVGTVKVYKGKRFKYAGGGQYDEANWREVGK